MKYEELLEQEAVLKAQFEELETDQLLPLQAEIQSKLATITAKQSATAQEIMELQFDIIEQQRIILEGMLGLTLSALLKLGSCRERLIRE